MGISATARQPPPGRLPRPAPEFTAPTSRVDILLAFLVPLDTNIHTGYGTLSYGYEYCGLLSPTCVPFVAVRVRPRSSIYAIVAASARAPTSSLPGVYSPGIGPGKCPPPPDAAFLELFVVRHSVAAGRATWSVLAPRSRTRDVMPLPRHQPRRQRGGLPGQCQVDPLMAPTLPPRPAGLHRARCFGVFDFPQGVGIR